MLFAIIAQVALSARVYFQLEYVLNYANPYGPFKPFADSTLLFHKLCANNRNSVFRQLAYTIEAQNPSNLVMVSCDNLVQPKTVKLAYIQSLNTQRSNSVLDWPFPHSAQASETLKRIISSSSDYKLSIKVNRYNLCVINELDISKLSLVFVDMRGLPLQQLWSGEGCDKGSAKSLHKDIFPGKLVLIRNFRDSSQDYTDLKSLKKWAVEIGLGGVLFREHYWLKQEDRRQLMNWTEKAA